MTQRSRTVLLIIELREDVRVSERERSNRGWSSPQERAAAVRKVRESGLSIVQVAEQLGLSDKTLWKWVNQARLAEIDPAGELTPEARTRIRDLEKENARLRRDLEFEKKAQAFFREPDQRDNGSR